MQVLAALLAGLVVGAVATFAVVRHWYAGGGSADPPRSAAGQRTGSVTSSERDDTPRVAPTPDPVTEGGIAVTVGHPLVSQALVRRVLEVMRSGALVVDADNEVILANPAARAMGVLKAGRFAVDDMARVVRAARSEGVSKHVVVDLPRGRLGREPTAVSLHVAPIDETGHVAVLFDDVTEARRLEAVRRDFVGNVSHELKTPVGALTLLAEAVQDAADDPTAVRRFAERMQHEGNRLGRLMKELIELSRLQGADPLPGTRVVQVDRVVAEAVDRTRLAADRAGITVVTGGELGLTVCGDEAQLITAVVNLVDNAIAYSPTGTRVALGTRLRQSDDGGALVEVSISDEGIGIAESDLERVFERFYRADPARSRATGGTGLGLAIVKHIASNHGGGVGVWSAAGSGSTFTLRLPAAASPHHVNLANHVDHVDHVDHVNGMASGPAPRPPAGTGPAAADRDIPQGSAPDMADEQTSTAHDPPRDAVPAGRHRGRRANSTDRPDAGRPTERYP